MIYHHPITSFLYTSINYISWLCWKENFIRKRYCQHLTAISFLCISGDPSTSSQQLSTPSCSSECAPCDSACCLMCSSDSSQNCNCCKLPNDYYKEYWRACLVWNCEGAPFKSTMKGNFIYHYYRSGQSHMDVHVFIHWRMNLWRVNVSGPHHLTHFIGYIFY